MEDPTYLDDLPVAGDEPSPRGTWLTLDGAVIGRLYPLGGYPAGCAMEAKFTTNDHFTSDELRAIADHLDGL